MTLIPYDSARFDALALRFLDLASTCRQIANRGREHAIDQTPVHDKKANEWLEKLELWTEEARQRCEIAAMKSLGAKRAKELLAADAAVPSGAAPREKPARRKPKSAAGSHE
jgi:hypothetical protein